MRFPHPPRRGTFLRRYKRFFADVRLDSGEVVAHVPNTGSLKTCLFENAACVVTDSNDPKRKLKCTLHLLETPEGWVGVHTGWPNALALEAWRAGRVAEWRGYAAAKPEFKISPTTRLDLVLAPNEDALAAGRGLHYVEIKSVTYAENRIARFPDAVTARGQKHLTELAELTRLGSVAELLFVVQRTDVTHFAPADHIDPIYGRLLREANRAGVRIRALACDIDPATGIELSGRALPVDLS